MSGETANDAALFEARGEDVTKAARISVCGTYRYWLGRVWGEQDALVFVMLNPSTADATVDDPTIRRCMSFARREGFGGISVMNLYAFRSPSPLALKRNGYPIGPDNDGYLSMTLAEQARRGNPVVAAWGAHARPGRVATVLGLVAGGLLMPRVDWRCLGTTKDGHPRHPLYVKGDQPLVPFGQHTAPPVSSVLPVGQVNP